MPPKVSIPCAQTKDWTMVKIIVVFDKPLEWEEEIDDV